MTTATLSPRTTAEERSSVRAFGGASLIIHGILFAIVALLPPRQTPPSSLPLQSIELEPEQEVEPEPEPEVEGNAEQEGGNGIPEAAPSRARRQVEPVVPERVVAPPEPVVTSPDSEVGDAATADETETDEGASADDSAAEGDGPPAGRGEGFGPGKGGAKPAPPVDFFRTFLATLPVAGRWDSSWTSLERGPAGRVTFRVTIKDGKLQPIQFVSPAPLYLRRIVAGAQQILRDKNFLIHPDLANASRVFVLDASIDRRSPHAETPEKDGVSQLGLLGIPMGNGAYFTYYSGHHVNLLMYRQAG